jgi:hypothetical protein
MRPTLGAGRLVTDMGVPIGDIAAVVSALWGGWMAWCGDRAEWWWAGAG